MANRFLDDLITPSMLGDVDPIVHSPSEAVGLVFDVAVTERELVGDVSLDVRHAIAAAILTEPYIRRFTH